MWWSQDLNSAVLKYVRSVCLLCWHIIPQCPHHVQPQKQKHCKTHTIEPGIWHLSWALAWGYLESTHLILTLKVPWPRLVLLLKDFRITFFKVYLFESQNYTHTRTHRARVGANERESFYMLIHTQMTAVARAIIWRNHLMLLCLNMYVSSLSSRGFLDFSCQKNQVKAR